MNIRAQSEKGFSLIELLVVVAIIGVLAAVGVVGYQGYIDSTKKSVTDSNAKAVHQWLVNTKTVRAAGIDTDPSECKSGTLGSNSTSNAASAVASTGCFGKIATSGGPFESFKNPYETTRKGSNAIRAVDSSSSVTSASSTCDTLDSNAKNGDIIIRVSGGTSHVDVYFCAKEGDTDKVLTKRDSTVSF